MRAYAEAYLSDVVENQGKLLIPFLKCILGAENR